MSFKGTALVAALLGCGVLFAYSFSKPEAAMADEAFAAGDYENAARLYERVRGAAAADGDKEAWISGTLALARSKVRLGDTAGARKLLDEFKKRHPAHSAGLLPGEILAAEGKISEAVSYFKAFLDTADAGSRTQAEFALAYLELRHGSAAKAAEDFAKLEKDPRVGAAARSLRIYGLIRARSLEQAKRLIAEAAADGKGIERIRLRMLSLLADLHEGGVEKFSSEWDTLRPELRPRPDPLVFDTLDEAARLMLGKSPERAAQLWTSAYDFADSDELRRDVLCKLFNCYAAFDVRKAAATAKRYAKYFPDASDRARLLSGAGRLLANSGDPKAALDCFKLILEDRDHLAVERYEAARDAAIAAERAGDPVATREYYRAMIDAAEVSSVNRERAVIAFAEYLLRCNDHSGAEQLLRRVTGSTVRSIADRAGELLIKALIPQKKYSSARVIAERLKGSADAGHAEFGLFYTAFLAEKLGELAAARRTYLEFAAKYPKSEFLPEARFSAALIAMNSGDYPVAAQEFFDYAASYPSGPSRNSALFWAVRGRCFAGDASGALEAFKLIGTPGPEYYAAALQLLESLRLAGKAEDGLKLCDAVDRSKCGDREKALLKLERAQLLEKCGRRKEAIAELGTEIPDDADIAADAAYLSGRMHLDQGEYHEALESFRKALKRRPGGVFGEVVNALVGDTEQKLYSITADKKHLREAAGIFDELSRKSAVPAIRLQSYQKLGSCRRDLGEHRRALAAYKDALDYAGLLKKQGLAFDPECCYKSVFEALAILEESRFANRSQRAVRIIDAYLALGLPGAAEDMAKRKREFDERCNMER